MKLHQSQPAASVHQATNTFVYVEDSILPSRPAFNDDYEAPSIAPVGMRANRKFCKAVKLTDVIPRGSGSLKAQEVALGGTYATGRCRSIAISSNAVPRAFRSGAHFDDMATRPSIWQLLSDTIPQCPGVD